MLLSMWYDHPVVHWLISSSYMDREYMTIIMETITYVSSHDLKGVVLILHLPVADHPLLP